MAIERGRAAISLTLGLHLSVLAQTISSKIAWADSRQAEGHRFGP
jgi:hypothetical protein